MIINLLHILQTTFQVHQDSNKGIACIVSSGLGVWIASNQSSKVHLYHATTYESLLEVSIAQAVSQKLQCKLILKVKTNTVQVKLQIKITPLYPM